MGDMEDLHTLQEGSDQLDDLDTSMGDESESDFPKEERNSVPVPLSGSVKKGRVSDHGPQLPRVQDREPTEELEELVCIKCLYCCICCTITGANSTNSSTPILFLHHPHIHAIRAPKYPMTKLKTQPPLVTHSKTSILNRMRRHARNSKP
jgi:hypothetical protein